MLNAPSADSEASAGDSAAVVSVVATTAVAAGATPSNTPTLSAPHSSDTLSDTLETSGALDVAAVDARVSRVVDLKTPGSGELSRNRYENMFLLGQHDQVKFVICSREDYEWARSKLIEFNLPQRVGEVLFSPSFQQVQARELAEWIIADNLPVRFQLQLHKLLWNDEPGH